MALELKIEVTQRAANCSGFTVADTTGTYDADANPTGYGSPNPERTDFKGVLLANRVNSYGATAISTVPNAAVPASWTVPTVQDGYYDLMFVLANDYNGFSSYTKNQVRLYEGSLYMATASTGMQKEWTAEEIDAVLNAAGVWEEGVTTGELVLGHIGTSGIDIMTALDEMGVSASTLSMMPAYITEAGVNGEPTGNWTKIVSISQFPFTAASTGTYHVRIPQLVYCHTDKCRLNRDTEFAVKDCSGCETDHTDMYRYYKVERAYEGSIFNFGLNNYIKAGDQIEMAEKICKSKGGGCNC